MSRSGYTDDIYDNWAHIRWRGAVKSAIRGRRGQAFLRELLADLDAMPDKRLIQYDIVRPDGSCCALGCVAKARGIDVSDLNTLEDEFDDGVLTIELAERLGIPGALAQEIVYLNDEMWDGANWDSHGVTPERRWELVRAWVARKIIEEHDDEHA